MLRCACGLSEIARESVGSIRLPISSGPVHYVVLVHVPDQGTRGVGKPKRTAEQLTALIKERSAQFGPWPAKMTMLLNRMNNTWEITV